jgi:hypothetical protein
MCSVEYVYLLPHSFFSAQHFFYITYRITGYSIPDNVNLIFNLFFNSYILAAFLTLKHMVLLSKQKRKRRKDTVNKADVCAIRASSKMGKLLQ